MAHTKNAVLGGRVVSGEAVRDQAANAARARAAREAQEKAASAAAKAAAAAEAAAREVASRRAKTQASVEANARRAARDEAEAQRGVRAAWAGSESLRSALDSLRPCFPDLNHRRAAADVALRLLRLLERAAASPSMRVSLERDVPRVNGAAELLLACGFVVEPATRSLVLGGAADAPSLAVAVGELRVLAQPPNVVG